MTLTEKLQDELKSQQLVWDGFLARCEKSPVNGMALAGRGCSAAGFIWVYQTALSWGVEEEAHRERVKNFLKGLMFSDTPPDANPFTTMVLIAKKDAAYALWRTMYGSEII